MLAIHQCTKLVVAAINGSAVGVGISMTLLMNIRMSEDEGWVMFARKGIVTEAASGYFLARLIDSSKAMHLLTTRALYPATDPLLRELFLEIVAAEKVLPSMFELAGEIARNTSAVSTRLVKDILWRNPGTAKGTHLLDSKILLGLFDGKDEQKGIDSSLQGRPADACCAALELDYSAIQKGYLAMEHLYAFLRWFFPKHALIIGQFWNLPIAQAVPILRSLSFLEMFSFSRRKRRMLI